MALRVCVCPFFFHFSFCLFHRASLLRTDVFCQHRLFCLRRVLMWQFEGRDCFSGYRWMGGGRSRTAAHSLSQSMKQKSQQNMLLCTVVLQCLHSHRLYEPTCWIILVNMAVFWTSGVHAVQNPEHNSGLMVDRLEFFNGWCRYLESSSADGRYMISQFIIFFW